MPSVLAALLFASPVLAMFPSIETPARTGERAPGDAAVVIGNANYFVLTDVAYADADARAFKSFLLYTRGVPSERIALFDAGANREKIVTAVSEMGRKVGRGGTLWIYFAGHGAASATTKERMLLGNDATADAESFDARGVTVSKLESLGAAGGGHVMLVLDACYGGVGRDGRALCDGCRTGVPYGYGAPAAGRSEWAAAGPNEISGPLHAAEHGAFTYFAVGALRGWADGEIDGKRDGVVTAGEASVYVERALGRAQVRGQHPKWIGEAERELARGVSEPEPTFAARLAGERTDPTPLNAAATERRLRLDDASTALLRRATLDWAAAKALAESPDGERAREVFLARYGEATVEVDGVIEAVRVPEVLEARTDVGRRDQESPTLGVLKWIPQGTGGFWLMQTEVTQGMWTGNPHKFEHCWAPAPEDPRGVPLSALGLSPHDIHTCPVTGVTWIEATRYANAMSKQERLSAVYGPDGAVDTTADGYRLPTEAEWEHAARGGETYQYSGSNEATEVGWVKANSGFEPHSVCGKARNGYGLCDMTGNVSEWTDSPKGSYRVHRGGSFASYPWSAGIRYRASFMPASSITSLGFRLARSYVVYTK